MSQLLSTCDSLLMSKANKDEFSILSTFRSSFKSAHSVVLENISEVDVEVGLFGVGAVAHRGAKGTEHGAEVISQLSTKHGSVVEDFVKVARLLCPCQAEKQVVIAAHTLLSLQLDSYELTADVLQVADAGEGHLLFDIVSEPLSAHSVLESGGYVGA